VTGYLTVCELAAYSGLSRATIWRRISDPVHPIPVFRVGRRVLVKPAEFDAWLERERRRQAARLDDVVAKVRQLF